MPASPLHTVSIRLSLPSGWRLFSSPLVPWRRRTRRDGTIPAPSSALAARHALAAASACKPAGEALQHLLAAARAGRLCLAHLRSLRYAAVARWARRCRASFAPPSSSAACTVARLAMYGAGGWNGRLSNHSAKNAADYCVAFSAFSRSACNAFRWLVPLLACCAALEIAACRRVPAAWGGVTAAGVRAWRDVAASAYHSGRHFLCRLSHGGHLRHFAGGGKAGRPASYGTGQRPANAATAATASTCYSVSPSPRPSLPLQRNAPVRTCAARTPPADALLPLRAADGADCLRRCRTAAGRAGVSGISCCLF